MSRFLSNKTLALESIDFQSLNFFKELILIITEAQALGLTALRGSDTGSRLAAIIHQHTNINVVVDIGFFDPSVSIPPIDKNNILIKNFERNFMSSREGLQMIDRAAGVARGTVSLKDSKVSGIYAEVKSTLRLPELMFVSNDYTAPEIAASILHEVGHLFVYFEYMGRSVTTNQALAGMSKALDESGTVEQREAVFVKLQKALRLSELDTTRLARSTDKKVAEIVVLSNIARQAESELGSNIYDYSTWEYLADQYAARMGAGRHLVLVFEKLYRGHISFRSSVGYVAVEALKATMLLGAFVAAATVGPIGLVFGTAALGMIAMDGAGDGTYNEPGARMKRLRNQIVENLKDKTLLKEDVQRLKDDLDAIDKVLASVQDRRQLLGVLWDAVIPSARKARSQEVMQQQLEDIAANDLFTKAAELRQLA